MFLVTSILTSHAPLHPASELQLLSALFLSRVCLASHLLLGSCTGFFQPTPVSTFFYLSVLLTSYLTVAYSLGAPLDSFSCHYSTPDLTTLCLGLRLQLSGRMPAVKSTALGSIPKITQKKKI